jgi:glycosyltransferase involved in cell wall biosynthesis
MFIGGTKPLHDCRIAIYQGLYRVPSSAWGKMYFKMFNPFLLWVMTKQVDVVIAKTSAAEKFMKERGYTNVFRIPVGIDTRTFRPLDRHSARVALGFAPSDIILGFVGKLLPGRDPLQCLRVLSLLKPYIENVRLAVVGRGPLKTEMLRLASSEGLSRDVVMIDRIPNIGMPLFYSAIDVLLMPMSVDGIFTYGMAMLESLACGTPVVSMPIPAATDLIVSGRNGFVVDFGDADAMAMRASQLVMHEHSRGKISFQCRNVAKKLDWTNLAPHFLRVYDKC